MNLIRIRLSCRVRGICAARMGTGRNQPGFILPTVLIAMLLIAVIAATLQSAVWRAGRNAHLGFAGERALFGADNAIAQQLPVWNAREFASMQIGDRKTTTTVMPGGIATAITLARTAIDAAIIEANTVSSKNGVTLDASRRVTRALVAKNLPLPLQNVMTALGAVSIINPASINSTDEVPLDWNTECANEPLVNATTSPIVDIAAARALFDANWNGWLALASHSDNANTVTQLAPIVIATSCAAGTGEPMRDVFSVTLCANEWGARAIIGSNAATLSGNSRHQGILIVEGDLTLTGTLEIDGLLIIRGAIDASAGQLLVHGAVLIRDTFGRGSRFGIATRVRYSRCALRRALSAVAAPAAITTGGWLERS
ncbi:MAG: hypothetical protein ABJC26_01370 [Gemmatimonadaceae bacterium]